MQNERQQAILELLKKFRTLSVKTIAEKIFVSEATVRRDLNEMQTLGLIERKHGGAILNENAEEISIFVRMEKNAKEKEQTANVVLSKIPEFHSVFIDSSSTALALAERMDLSFKTVVTNNLQTAIRLSKKQNVNLILLGGNVQSNTVSAAGSWTIRQLREFSFDLSLFSCAAIQNGIAYERSIEQREIKLTAYERSKMNILLADETKFFADGTYLLAPLSDFDLIATNTAPPDFNGKENIPIIW